MSQKIRFWLYLAVALLLVGCLVPEKFTASITMRTDGSYIYRFDGTMTNAVAAMMIKKNGGLSSKDETALRGHADKLAKTHGVRKSEYLGSGRYDISTALDYRPEQMPGSGALFTLKKGKDGTITIASLAIKENVKRDLAAANVTINGTVEVRLPHNAKVIAHNASSTPGLISSSYGWKVGHVRDQPYITFKLTS